MKPWASQSASWGLRMDLLRKTISGSYSSHSPNKSGTASTLQPLKAGTPEHDLLGRVASSLFRNVRYYSTYKDPAVPPRGQHAIIPTQEEIDLKNRALDCYASQLSLNDVRVHFDTVRGKTEYLNDSPGHDPFLSDNGFDTSPKNWTSEMLVFPAL